MKEEEEKKNLEKSQENSSQEKLSFEAAFLRLEEILEKMNSGSISLDESLKLYEEADNLINICNKRLSHAERKIETLIKNRKGELVLDQDQKPTTQDFNFKK